MPPLLSPLFHSAGYLSGEDRQLCGNGIAKALHWQYSAVEGLQQQYRFNPDEECVLEASLMLDPIFPTLVSYCTAVLDLVSWIPFRQNETKDALQELV